MAKGFRIVVVGASAGGIPALQNLVAQLPADLPAAVFVVLHVPDYEPSSLAAILDRAGALQAKAAVDGEDIRLGQIYVAVPGRHLLVEDNRVGVKRGPKENRFRPAIDPLFRSAAYTYRERVIGIVLSGMLSDGCSGLWTIKQFGGTAIVQDPGEAEYNDMPESALREVDVDYAIPVGEMGALISRLSEQVAEPLQLGRYLAGRVRMEVDVSAGDNAFNRGLYDQGQLTPFTCPECHGTLIKIKEGRLVRYRCHTGHGFTANALLAGITNSAEESLWSAVRALEEGVMLLDQIGQDLAELGHLEEAERFKSKAEETRSKARALQKQAASTEQLSEDNIGKR